MAGDEPPANDNPPGDGESDEPAPGVVFGLFTEKRTRFLLYLLYDRGGTIPIDEVAERLASWEGDAAVDDLPTETVERIQRTLHHASLPKLADHGFLTYEHETGAVTLTDRGDRLEPYLEFAREREPEPVEAFLERNRRNAG